MDKRNLNSVFNIFQDHGRGSNNAHHAQMSPVLTDQLNEIELVIKHADENIREDDILATFQSKLAEILHSAKSLEQKVAAFATFVHELLPQAVGNKMTADATKIAKENTVKQRALDIINNNYYKLPIYGTLIDFIIYNQNPSFYHSKDILEFFKLMPNFLEIIAHKLAHQYGLLTPDKRNFFIKLKQSPVFTQALIKNNISVNQFTSGVNHSLAYHIICAKPDLESKFSAFFSSDSKALSEAHKKYNLAIAVEKTKAARQERRNPFSPPAAISPGK